MNGTDADCNTPVPGGDAGQDSAHAALSDTVAACRSVAEMTGPETQLRHTARNSAGRLFAVEQVIAWMRQDILDDPPCPNDAATLAETLLVAGDLLAEVRGELIGALDPVAA